MYDTSIIYDSCFIVLLQVDEGSAEEGKKGFVDLKRVVWHKAFFEFLRRVETLSKTNDLVRRVFQVNAPHGSMSLSVGSDWKT